MVGLSLVSMQRISYLRKLQAVQKVATILTQSPTPLIALDLQGRITDLNSHSALILGAGLDRLAAVEFASIMAPAYRERAAVAFELAKKGKGTQSLELTLVRLSGESGRSAAEGSGTNAPSDGAGAVRAVTSGGGGQQSSAGGVMEVLMSTVPNLDEDGYVCSIYCFLQDCTEIKRLHKEAHEHAMEQVRMRAIEENLAVTFHELRNPLNGCVGFQRLAMQSLDGALQGVTAAADAGNGAGSGAGSGGVASAEHLQNLKNARADQEQAVLCADHAVRFLQTLASTHRLFSSGLGEPSPMLVNLREVTTSAATVIKPQLKAGVALDLQLPTQEGLCVVIDATRISQVIINLAQNASRFTNKGAVSVLCSYARSPPPGGGGQAAQGDPAQGGAQAAATAAEPQQQAGGKAAAPEAFGTVTVMVRDSGIGLHDKTKATLLTYMQPSSGVEVGCGIGLYLAQKLLLSMGSKLEFRSPWTDQHPGTEFKFSISVREGVPPQLEPDARHDQPALPKPLSHPKELRALIADDIKVNRMLLTRALKMCLTSALACVEVATAEAAIEAAAAAKDHPFDLIFMDENFSVEEGALSGSDAVRAIRAAEATSAADHPKQRSVIVACTGYAADNAAEHGRFFEAGCDAVWGKPIPSHTDGAMQRELGYILPGLHTS